MKAHQSKVLLMWWNGSYQYVRKMVSKIDFTIALTKFLSDVNRLLQYMEPWSMKVKTRFLLIFFVEASTICILINHTLCTFDNIYLGIPMSIDRCDWGSWKQNVIKSHPWCCLKMANVDSLRWFVFVWDKIGNMWNDVQGVVFQFKEKLKNSFFWSIVRS